MKNSLFSPLGIPFDLYYKNDSPKFPVGPHSHNGAEIYLTLTELPDVLLGDQVFAVPADTLILIPPFCIHQLYHETGKFYERYVMNIQDNWIKNVFFEHSGILPCLLPGSAPLLVSLSLPEMQGTKKELMDQLHKLLAFSDRSDPLALSCFFMLLSSLLKITKTVNDQKPMIAPSSTQKRVNEIISYIQDHIREDLHIQELADYFHLNPDYMARLFKQHAHVTIGHYLALQKFDFAQKLLRDGMSVQAVSEELGFSSYAHFFKTFQKFAGISPSKYRSRYANTKNIPQG